MKNNGGPAFPTGTAYQGMTLRDYFAAQAMQATLKGAESYETVAEYAYVMADKMLKAREK